MGLLSNVKRKTSIWLRFTHNGVSTPRIPFESFISIHADYTQEYYGQR